MFVFCPLSKGGVEFVGSLSFRHSTEAPKLLKKIKENLAAKQWANALDLMATVRKDYPDTLVKVADVFEYESEKLHWSVKQVLRQIEATLPPEAHEMYVLRFNDTAKHYLKRAFDTDESDPLERVVEEYFTTPTAARALEHLGGRAFQEGRFSDAKYWFQQLWEWDKSPLTPRYPAAHLSPEIRARAYAAYLLSDVALGSDPDEADRQLRSHIAENLRIPFAGRDEGIFENFSAAAHNDHLPSVQEDWNYFSGTPSGHRVVNFDPQRTYRLTEFTLPEKAVSTEPNSREIGGYPLVLGDYVWLGYRDRVIRLSLHNYILATFVNAETAYLREENPAPKIGNGYLQSYVEELPVNVPLCADQTRVIAKIWHDEIIALDRQRPKSVLWRTTAAKILPRLGRTAEEDHFYFASVPTIDGDSVYVLAKHTSYQTGRFPVSGEIESMTKNRRFYVVALNAGTGDVRWLKEISEYSLVQMNETIPGQMRDELIPQPWPVDEPPHDRRAITVHHRKLYVQTNLGVFAVLQARTGDFVWLVNYSRGVTQGYRARLDPDPSFSLPVADNNRVATYPADLGELFVSDSETGEPIANSRFTEANTARCGRVQGWKGPNLLFSAFPMSMFLQDPFFATFDLVEEGRRADQQCPPRGLTSNTHYLYARAITPTQYDSRAELRAFSLTDETHLNVRVDSGFRKKGLPFATHLVPFGEGNFLGIRNDKAFVLSANGFTGNLAKLRP
jgi:hypothetical protein